MVRELGPEVVPKLPVRGVTRDAEGKPIKGGWSAYAKRSWAAWWRDGASETWSSADHATVEQALRLLDQYAKNQTVSAAAALTRLLDGLGLTQRGKRDLRLLVVEAPTAEPERELSEIEVARQERDRALGLA